MGILQEGKFIDSGEANKGRLPPFTRVKIFDMASKAIEKEFGENIPWQKRLELKARLAERIIKDIEETRRGN